MQKIQDSSQPNSDSCSEIKNPASGGSDELQEDGRLKAFAKIHAANRKLRLSAVLKTYGVKVQKNSSYAWSPTVTCPFPTHKGSNERTPSFGYNFVEDRFNCLGCKISGRAVEFIAEMEGKGRVAVAESILDHYSDSEFLEDPVEQEDPRVEKLLFFVAKEFRRALKIQDKEKLEQVEKIIWWFDRYLYIKAGSKNGCKSQNIDVEELEARVFKVQDLLRDIV